MSASRGPMAAPSAATMVTYLITSRHPGQDNMTCTRYRLPAINSLHYPPIYMLVLCATSTPGSRDEHGFDRRMDHADKRSHQRTPGEVPW